MSYLVSDFIINPVLRQARRFSEISRTTLAGSDDQQSLQPDAVSDSGIAEDLETQHDELSQSPNNRPISSSTQETRVDDAASSPQPVEALSFDQLGFPPATRKHGPIPEDDGMRVLRARIQEINTRNITPEERARLIHDILLEGYHASRGANIPSADIKTASQLLSDQNCEPLTPPRPLDSLKFWQSQLGDNPAPDFVLSESDITPTYAPVRQSKSPVLEGSKVPSPPVDSQPPLGCQHYERNVKLQCSTCEKWYTCRFCHDSQEDHNLIRSETKNMLCMLCATPQRASDICVNCGEISGQYYCGICKLWENRKSKPIYHCNDCGICRRGLGLGKDFFHCKTCRACITTSIETSHKCIERSTDCDCPICGEYMFTSPKPVVFMTCGHSIHKKCYDQHMKVSYKCPICNKSLANMETQFRNLDLAIQSQPMPPDFRDTKAIILCNDCSGRSTVSYHWLGLKCSICRSYNTVELQILGGAREQAQAHIQLPVTERPAESVRLEQVQPSATPQSHHDSRPIAMPNIASRPPTAIPNRRRHSSHVDELQRRTAERVARSLSPLAPLGSESYLDNLDSDAESDDDMLGIWRGVRSADESGDSDEFASEDEDSDDAGIPEDAEDDDDEDDDLIVLIGHR